MLGSIKAAMRDLKSLRFNVLSTILHFIDNQKIKNERNISKIYMGCGSDYRNGWLNLDLSRKADYWIDLRNKVNIQDNSVDFIMSSHTVEHLEHDELIFHLGECHRMLKEGGKIRIGIPDFVSVIRNYNNNNFFNKYKYILPSNKFDNIPENLICYMDLINRAFYEFGHHKIALDVEKITNLLVFVGFDKDKVNQVEYLEGIDVESRKESTIYIEAVK